MAQINAETAKAIDDVNNGRNLSGPYRSMRELRESLDDEPAQERTMDY
jgi:hypothetical protein